MNKVFNTELQREVQNEIDQLYKDFLRQYKENTSLDIDEMFAYADRITTLNSIFGFLNHSMILFSDEDLIRIKEVGLKNIIAGIYRERYHRTDVYGGMSEMMNEILHPTMYCQESLKRRRKYLFLDIEM